MKIIEIPAVTAEMSGPQLPAGELAFAGRTAIGGVEGSLRNMVCQPETGLVTWNDVLDYLEREGDGGGTGSCSGCGGCGGCGAGGRHTPRSVTSRAVPPVEDVL